MLQTYVYFIAWVVPISSQDDGVRIAITGGIGEGKSTVLGYLSELGYRVANADTMARDLFRSETIQQRLAAASGLAAPVNPAALRQAMVENPGLRREVNRIMHPAIVGELRLSHAEFIEVPLLIEACLQREFDLVWVVTCGPDEQLRRLRDRYGEGADLQRMVSVQLTTRAKAAFADQVIRTNGDSDSVRRLVSEAVSALFGRP